MSPPATPPVSTPGAYLAACRETAGLSLGALARNLAAIAPPARASAAAIRRRQLQIAEAEADDHPLDPASAHLIAQALPFGFDPVIYAALAAPAAMVPA